MKYVVYRKMQFQNNSKCYLAWPCTVIIIFWYARLSSHQSYWDLLSLATRVVATLSKCARPMFGASRDVHWTHTIITQCMAFAPFHHQLLEGVKLTKCISLIAMSKAISQCSQLSVTPHKLTHLCNIHFGQDVCNPLGPVMVRHKTMDQSD